MTKYILPIFLCTSMMLFGQHPEKLQSLQTKYENNRQHTLKQLSTVESKGVSFSEEVKKGIIQFDSNGMPIFTELLDEKGGKASQADILWNWSFNGTTYNLIGSNMTVYMWDGGNVRMGHQEFGGRVTNMQSGSQSTHSTAVAGVIGASGVVPEAKGMAPDISIIARDYIDFQTEIPVQTDAKVSNHSYGVPSGWSFRDNAPAGIVDPGQGWYFLSDYNVSDTEPNYNGNYLETTVYWDELAYAMPQHIIVKSSGNSKGKGPAPGDDAFYWDGTNFVPITAILPNINCANGYDCLIEESAAKNIVVVGAIKQLTTSDGRYSSTSDVILTDFSSSGPRDDGGIKPDVVAVGQDVYSTAANSNTSYTASAGIGWAVGTSFSAPLVAGIMALWDELYFIENDSYLPSDLGKALLCHTTFESGPHPGPDYHFGWGLINAERGAETIVYDDISTYVEQENLVNGGTYSYNLFAAGTEPLKATISWLDPAATPIPNSVNDRTSRLINDLDLKIIKINDNSQTLAWKLDPDNPSEAATKGDNIVDNVEQVVVENPEAGAEYRILISHKGTLLDDQGSPLAQTPFGLVVSGIQDNMNVEYIQNTSGKFHIFPNPALDTVHVSYPEDIEIRSAMVVDATGKIVQYISNWDTDSIAISHLEKGIYRVILKTSSESKSLSFIKK